MLAQFGDLDSGPGMLFLLFLLVAGLCILTPIAVVLILWLRDGARALKRPRDAQRGFEVKIDAEDERS
jgi:hypothetical protein